MVRRTLIFLLLICVVHGQIDPIPTTNSPVPNPPPSEDDGAIAGPAPPVTPTTQPPKPMPDSSAGSPSSSGTSLDSMFGPDPPVVDPPSVDPPAVDPPSVDPPAVDPPAVDPPAVDPPAVDPPSVNPPAPPPSTDDGDTSSSVSLRIVNCSTPNGTKIIEYAQDALNMDMSTYSITPEQLDYYLCEYQVTGQPINHTYIDAVTNETMVSQSAGFFFRKSCKYLHLFIGF